MGIFPQPFHYSPRRSISTLPAYAPKCHQISAACRVGQRNLTTSRPQVGSRAGARTLGSGGISTAFAMALSPATMVTFPVPATSNPACGFPAPGFPVYFMLRLMGPIMQGVLSVAYFELCSH